MRRGARVTAALLLALAGAGAAAPSSSVRRTPIALDLKRSAPREGSVLVPTVLQGGAALEWAGSRLAAGDVNGDGIADLVIAAPGGTDDRPSRRGRVYVLLGGVAPRPVVELSAPALPPAAAGSRSPVAAVSHIDVIIEGRSDFDHLGRGLAVCDLDGDGLADIIAGAPRADGPRDTRPDCGEVEIVHGANALPRVIDPASPPAGIRVTSIVGRTAGDAFGSEIACGDVTGDGRPDLVIGSPLADGAAGALGALETGEVTVLPGGVGSLLSVATIDLRAGAATTERRTLGGADAGDQAGGAIALGDFDGDGVLDMAVGARGADGPDNQRLDAGEVYLMFGAAQPPAGTSLARAADAIIFAPDIGDLGGSSLAMGDVDGDGRAELAIGAETADASGNARLDAGEVHLMRGRSRQELERLRPAPVPRPGSRPAAATPAESEPKPSGPIPIDLAGPPVLPAVMARRDTPAPREIRTYHGEDPGDHTNVKLLADLDADGRAEMIVGAEDSSGLRNSRAGGGEIRVVSPASEWTAITIFGPAGNAHLGKAAAAADLDGDGRLDLAIAAPQAGQALSGKVWVIGAAWEEILRTRPSP